MSFSDIFAAKQPSNPQEMLDHVLAGMRSRMASLQADPSTEGKTSNISAEMKQGGTSTKRANALDPTLWWYYAVLWYLIQNFVSNNTTTNRVIMRTPAAVATADTLTISVWWVCMFGAIVWLALVIVLASISHSYDFGAMSGDFARYLAA